MERTDEQYLSKHKTIHVAIVGGGLSGLVVASLLPNGTNWLLLEAHPTRFGGRLCNAYSREDIPIDMGAAWIWRQPHMINLLHSLELETFPQPGDSNSTRVSGGTFAIVEAICTQLQKSAWPRLLLDWRLVSVDDSASLAYNGSSIKLTNDRGEIILASNVILAAPPKILHARVTFTPALPEDRRHAMQHSRTWMAGVTKIALVFPQRFWPLEVSNTGLPSGYLGPAFQVYDGGVESLTPSAVSVESPTPSMGVLTFFALVRSAADSGAPGESDVADTLLGWQCATQLAMVWRKQYGLTELADRLLTSFDQKNGKRDHGPEVMVHRWPLEEYISDERQPQQVNPHPQPNSLLGRPEWNGRLIFAGTEADQNSPGFMEGAVGAAKAAVDVLSSRLQNE